MADRRAKYKQKGDNFGDLESSRMSRLEKQDQRRKEIRNQNFSRLRPLDEITKTHTSGKNLYTFWFYFIFYVYKS